MEYFASQDPHSSYSFYFAGFEYLISGMKNYMDFGQTGPWSVV